MTNAEWSSPNALEFATSGSIAFASIEDVDVLLFTTNEGEMMAARYDISSGTWSEASSINQRTHGSFALMNFYDHKSETHQLMLCWVGSDGFIQSMVGDASGFSDSVIPVGQLTDGAMALGQLGASVYLVYKDRNTRKMRITSYNVGPFNSFDAKDLKLQ